MSLQHRSSNERLTPEYRPPDREESPLDFPLDDVLPYDSFDDESFVVDSPSDRSSHTAVSSPGFLSDSPDYDLIAAVDRSIADSELDLLLIQGEHAIQMQNARGAGNDMAAQHREALLVCRRAADLEHRLEVLSVQVRQLNQDGPPADGGNGGPSSYSRAGQHNNSSLLVGDERVPLPPNDQQLASLANDERLPQNMKRRLEAMDGRIGQIDMDLTAHDDVPPYILNAVDRRHFTDRNINQAINVLVDGQSPGSFFQGEDDIERAFRFERNRDTSLRDLTDELFVRVAEVVRLESGFEREIFSRIRAAEQRLRDHTYDGGLRGAESLFGNGRAELRARDKIRWLQRQKDNLRRLQLDHRANPDLNPQPLHGPFWPTYAYPVDPAAQMQRAPHTRPQFMFRLRAQAHGNLHEVPPLDREPALSLLQARYRVWQTRRAAENLSAAASLRQRQRPPPPWGAEESEYEDPFDSSSPVREVAPPAPFRTRRISDAHDQLVDVELGRPRQRRLPPTLPTQRGPPQVIDLTDLTEEPDSPVLFLGASARPSLRALRRHNSQGRANPPPLARSDSSILGGGPGAQEVIDLTEDDPEPQPAWAGQRQRLRTARTAGSRRQPDARLRARNSLRQRQMHEVDRLRENRGINHLESLRRQFEQQRNNLIGHRDNLLGLLNPLFPGRGGAVFDPVGPVNLHYEFHAFNGRPPSPKPAAEVPEPAREGFTRDTDPDKAFVCPGCNEELAYDPDEAPGAPAPTRSKAKRSRSEHHFWALKSCGHVYCSDCFENRKPSAKRPKIFPTAQGNTASICCVEDCDSPVLPKGNWVGIYM
ncbi:hypothetical protein F5X68DRAFT_44462 [Plectosphaerella plurivora]|uniref:Uncharacterized protein n=1 Tax=Plectosphaerella plurivora TaxID=936078 RepID=A0A9P8V1C6_9PEZI|nr:hypothetical protein F5X68DRAFT_44462 [Plectosphaerella plurivora]